MKKHSNWLRLARPTRQRALPHGRMTAEWQPNFCNELALERLSDSWLHKQSNISSSRPHGRLEERGKTIGLFIKRRLYFHEEWTKLIVWNSPTDRPWRLEKDAVYYSESFPWRSREPSLQNSPPRAAIRRTEGRGTWSYSRGPCSSWPRPRSILEG